MGASGYHNRLQDNPEALEVVGFKERTKQMTKMALYEQVTYRVQEDRRYLKSGLGSLFAVQQVEDASVYT